MKNKLTNLDINALFEALNTELKQQKVVGELYLVGGAVMCLVFHARPSTADIDAYFEPTSTVRAAAKRVAAKMHVSDNWLNDGVKGFLSDKGDYSNYLELSHLKVLAAKAEYLLAMKCLAMRIGEEFHDIDDIRYLLRTLGITRYQEALETISHYYPKERFPQKTLYALEELLAP